MSLEINFYFSKVLLSPWESTKVILQLENSYSLVAVFGSVLLAAILLN